MKAYKVLIIFILSILIVASIIGCRRDKGLIDTSPNITVSPRVTNDMSPDLSPDHSPGLSPGLSPGTSPGNGGTSPGTSPGNGGANGASKQV